MLLAKSSYFRSAASMDYHTESQFPKEQYIAIQAQLPLHVGMASKLEAIGILKHFPLFGICQLKT